MYYHSAVIRALREENRNFSKLLTRTREILREPEINFAKQQLTNTLKDLLDFTIISKEKQDRSVIYSLNTNPFAEEGIALIVAIEEGSSTIDKNQWLTEKYEERALQIHESSPINKEELYSEITLNLVAFSMFMFKLSMKLMYFQNQSMRLPFLVKELREQERRTREQFDRVSVIMKNIGKPHYSRFLETLDTITAKEIKEDYDKFVKDNLFFTQS